MNQMNHHYNHQSFSQSSAFPQSSSFPQSSAHLEKCIKEYQVRLQQIEYREQLVHLRELICDHREQFLNISNPQVNLHASYDVSLFIASLGHRLWLTICPCFHSAKDLQSNVKNTEDYFAIQGIFILLNLSKTFYDLEEATILSTLETDQYREFEHYLLVENHSYCLTAKGVAKLLDAMQKGGELHQNILLFTELKKLQPKFTNMFSYGYH